MYVTTSEGQPVDIIDTNEGPVEVFRSDGTMPTEQDEEVARFAMDSLGEALSGASSLFQALPSFLPSFFGESSGPSWIDQQFAILDDLANQMQLAQQPQPRYVLPPMMEGDARLQRVAEMRMNDAMSQLVGDKARRAPEGYVARADPAYFQMDLVMAPDGSLRIVEVPVETNGDMLDSMDSLSKGAQAEGRMRRAAPAPGWGGETRDPEMPLKKDEDAFFKLAGKQRQAAARGQGWAVPDVHAAVEEHMEAHGPQSVFFASAVVSLLIASALALCCCCCCARPRGLEDEDEAEAVFMEQSSRPLLETYEALHGDDDLYLDIPDHEHAEGPPVLYSSNVDTVTIVSYTKPSDQV